MSETWQGLVKVALLGTARGSGELPPAAGPLGDAQSRWNGGAAEPPRKLAGAAALASVHRRAGQQPLAIQERPTAAPEQDLPLCGPRASAQLDLLRDEPLNAVLPEWLAALNTAGRRIPERRIPWLLGTGVRRKELRPAIASAIGARGRWLAAQNPEWSYAQASAADAAAAAHDPNVSRATWDTAELDQRLLLLQQLRTLDPGFARELLAGTWAQEDPDDRELFLGLFSTGLSDADEPFLESVLDDKRKDVREIATALLTALPASAFVKRMFARAQPCLAWSRGTLEATAPAAYDKSWSRDGIDAKVPAALAKGKNALGEKAWWLLQLVSAVPPSLWNAAWKVEPAAILKAADRSDFDFALRTGFRDATLRAGDAAWADAWLDSAGGEDWQNSETFELFQLLPHARREARALERLRVKKVDFHDGSLAVRCLLTCDQTWSAPLAQEVLRLMCDETDNWQIDFKPFALRFPLTQAAQAVERISAKMEKAPDWWRRRADDFLAILTFRKDMAAALQE